MRRFLSMQMILPQICCHEVGCQDVRVRQTDGSSISGRETGAWIRTDSRGKEWMTALIEKHGKEVS